MSTSAYRRAREQHDQALRDLVELDEQVAAGELPASRAAVLRGHYEAEAATALAVLDTRSASDESPSRSSTTSEDAATPKDHAPSDDATRRPWWRDPRRLTAAVGGVAVVVLLVVGVTRSVQPRPAGGFVTGNEATGASGAGRDLSEVTIEEMAEVVEDNPDVVPMRLALAHRYLDDGQYDQAVDHYMQVLERQDDPEAMSHLGWLMYLDDQLELAVPLLEESLDRQPDDAEVQWFLANVRLYGQRRPEQALPLLEELLNRGDLGDQRDVVRQAIDDAMAMQRGEAGDGS